MITTKGAVCNALWAEKTYRSRGSLASERENIEEYNQYYLGQYLKILLERNYNYSVATKEKTGEV